MASENKARHKKPKKRTNRKDKKKSVKKSSKVKVVNNNNFNYPEKKKNLLIEWLEKLLKVAGLLPLFFDWWKNRL